MRIFISGGCKNGKTSLAEKLAYLQNKEKLYYIATMLPADKEDETRIIKHRKDREYLSFETIELPFQLETLTNKLNPKDSLLIDSLTALLGNEMFMRGDYNQNASEVLTSSLLKLYSYFENVVVISDYIYSSQTKYDEITEHYRKSLSLLDLLTAKEFDVVIEVCYGRIICHKGKEEFDELHKRLDSLFWDV